jgi:hypothetical protein
MEEVWVPISGFPRYEISNMRRVRLFSGKIIKVYKNEYVKLNGIKVNISFLLEVNAPDTRYGGVIWPI